MDRKRSIRTFLMLAAAFIPAATVAQPVVGAGSILNAASYAYSGLPNSGIAQGSMFAVFGQRMGPATLAASNGFPYASTLAGTSIKVTVNGTSVDSYPMFTSAGQLAAILPSNAPVGTGTLTVTYNGQTSPAVPIRVVKSSFGAFTVNSAGSGPASVQNVISSTDTPTNSLTKAAHPGQYAILWGTGLGPVSATDEAIKPLYVNLDTVSLELFVGGKPAVVTYKGRAGYAGVDQINFIVPDGVEGCYVPIVVKTGDIVSNFSTMAVSKTSDVCSDPTSFSEQDLRKAQESGVYRTGAVNLSRIVSNISAGGFTLQSNTETGSAVFYKYTYDSLLRSQGTNQTATSIGACSVYSFQGNITSPVDPIRPEILDAGPVINVTGPTGTKQLTKVTGGVYAGELGGGTTGIPGVPPAAPLFLEPGTYTVDNGSGGPGANAVAAFRTTIKIAPFVKWENQGDITTVTRSQPLPITWSGGDADGYVIIIGSSATTAPVVGASFVCLEKASAKQFSVPPAVLLALPATGSSDTSVGSLIVTGTNGLSPFTAGGLDVGAVAASGGTLKTLKYQ